MSNSPRIARPESRRRDIALLLLACLLLLFALYRFASLAADWRNRAALNDRAAYRPATVTTNIGPKPPGPLTPFSELNLTEAQRQKIDAILRDNMPKRPPNNDQPGKPHLVKFSLPMNKILEVLTPEQRRKWEQEEQERRNQKGMFLSHDGPPPMSGNSSAPTLFFKVGPSSTR